jgi:hypothetical protein
MLEMATKTIKTTTTSFFEGALLKIPPLLAVGGLKKNIDLIR